VTLLLKRVGEDIPLVYTHMDILYKCFGLRGLAQNKTNRFLTNILKLLRIILNNDSK